MKSESSGKETVWERTSVQCLLRNKQSGGYYGRFTVSGKQKWFSLESDVFSVAKQRLGDKAAEVEKLRSGTSRVLAGKATMGELMDAYEARTKANPDFRPATVASRLVARKKLKKTWLAIETLEPKQITPAGIFEWVSKFKMTGTNFVPPGAKKAVSATSVNRAVGNTASHPRYRD